MRASILDPELFIERKFSVSFDILDAATEEYMSIRESGRLLKFSRQMPSLGSSVYEFRNYDFGNLGKIKLRKLNNHETELTIDYPPIPPTPDLTPAELTQLDLLPETERRKARQDLHDNLLHEKTVFLHHQDTLFRTIVNKYLKLLEELDGGAEGGQPAPAEEQGNGRKGGRPRNAEDDWALAEVRTKRRKPEDVYPEWLTMIGERARILDDPHDSFNKAISLKRMKGMKRK